MTHFGVRKTNQKLTINFKTSSQIVQEKEKENLEKNRQTDRRTEREREREIELEIELRIFRTTEIKNWKNNKAK